MSVYTNSSSSTPAEIQQYASAVLDLVGDSEPLKVLRRTEKSLRSAVKRLTKRRLTKREAPGKWSIAQVLQHLADSEIVYGWRLRMTATPADFQRIGIHAERGEESLGRLMRLYAGHDLLHLRQIERIKNSL